MLVRSQRINLLFAIAWWIQAMAQRSLDSQPCGLPTFDCEGADVSGPMTAYALPLMMGRKFVGETTGKVVRLADVFRIPNPQGLCAEDIDAGEHEVLRADWMKPKAI